MHLRIGYGCFYAKMAELSSCNWDANRGLKYLSSGPLQEKFVDSYSRQSSYKLV